MQRNPESGLTGVLTKKVTSLIQSMPETSQPKPEVDRVNSQAMIKQEADGKPLASDAQARVRIEILTSQT